MSRTVRYSPVNLDGQDSTKGVYSTISGLTQSYTMDLKLRDKLILTYLC